MTRRFPRRRAGRRPRRGLLANRGNLAASEALHRSLVENSSGVIMLLGADGLVRHASGTVRRILGWEPTHVVGQFAVDLVAPTDRAALARALSSSRTGTARQTLALRWQCADGSVIDGETVATNLLEDTHVGGIVLNTRDVSDRVALERELSWRAHHDALSGLANRTLLAQAMAAAEQRRTAGGGEPYAVLFCDVDGFKAVNDGIGHAAGDAVLVQAARRLSAAVRDGDVVARISGDEFAVLLRGVRCEEADRAAARVVAAFDEPFSTGGRVVRLGASVGVVVPAGPPRSPDELLTFADLAMYSAKAAGGARFAAFHPRMYDDAVRRRALVADLRGAIEGGGITVAYQPVVALADGRVSGVEALARWHHDERGVVEAAEFVPLAEESGLVADLDRAVVGLACRDASAWAANRRLLVGVNLSGQHLNEPGFTNDVIGAAAAAGLAAGALVVEITETALVAGTRTTVERLETLRRAGVRLALDDFGTGYSSLAYLRDLPVNTLKVDRRFVHGFADDPKAVALVRHVLDLAATFGLDVVAEGIERPRDLARLRELGCGFGQGFLLGRPVAAAEVDALVDGFAARWQQLVGLDELGARREASASRG